MAHKSAKKRKPTDGRQVVARNRRVTFEYLIDGVFEAGLMLMGTEVKSLRAGQVTLGEGYVTVRDGEAWLIGVHIPEYKFGNRNNHEPRRERKLLLNAREIERIRVKIKEQGFTGVPMELYFKGGWAKLEFGMGKGKKHYDKRQAERQKTARRELRDRRDEH